MFNAGMRSNSVAAPLQLKPYMLEDEDQHDGGACRPHLSIKATTTETGGAFNLFTLAGPLGLGTPLHIHYQEDVALFVLEGSLTVFWGEEGREARAGSYVFMPRGIAHGFRVKSAVGARILFLAVPAGIDGLAHECCFGQDTSECTSAAARYKIEILGPLPD